MTTLYSFNDYKHSIQNPHILYEDSIVSTFISIRLSTKLDCCQNILAIEEIANTDNSTDILTKCKLDCNRCWIDIPVDSINKSPKLHSYKITIINTSTYEYLTEYFTYKYISNKIDKPYIYMKDGDKCENND